MQRKIKFDYWKLSFIFLLVCMYSCSSTQPTVVVTKDPLSVTIDLVNVINDRVKVSINTGTMHSDSITYHIPKIIPGTYQNNNYGDFIEEFKALDSNGSPLPVIKENKNSWKIANARRLSSISYWVNDTFDSEDVHEIFSPTGSNIKKDKNFILNLYAFVGYFEKQQERIYKLLIKHPSHLESSSSLTEIMPEKSMKNDKMDTDFFIFKRYSDLVDSPIMYSNPNKVSITIRDIEVLLSVYSPNNVHKAEFLKPQLERVIRAQKNFLGAINTTKKYSILLYLSSAGTKDAKGFGALEHNTSTLVVLPESLSLEKLDEYITNTVSHEFFHIVTPINIHSETIHNFDYNNPKMSDHLWLYEGTTEYFSILFQIREALITKSQFFDIILEKINAAKTFNDSLSFTEMSRNILQEPYKSNYRNVYEKGALISMCIDIIIREQSEGKLGILDLIKELSETYGSHQPFKEDQLLTTIKKIGYPEVVKFLETHVDGNTPIDYSFYLKKVGLVYGIKEVSSSYFMHEQEPFVKGVESTNEIVFTEGVTNNTFLRTLGVQQGDVLLQINQKKYSLQNIYDVFSDHHKWEEDTDIFFLIKRDDEEIKLKTKVTAPTFSKTVLIQDPNATERQLQLLKKWIND